MILDIVQIWDPVLRRKSIDILNIWKYKKCIENLKETLSASWWVWLAAPQVWISVSLFVMHISPTLTRPDLKDRGTYIVINPRIISHSEDMYMDREWCLSIWWKTLSTGLKAKVPRFNRIEVEYLNEWWKLISTRLEWFEGRVFQHEYDHLQWIFFLDQMTDMSTIMTHERYTKLK